MTMPATVTRTVIDVDQHTFQEQVIERSRDLPVVVDFWAAWCGPCRTLGPILESLADEYGGRFVLAKLNVDENQQLAVQYNVQGIPAVKAFRDGRVASEFVGALPRPAVRQFIEKLVPNEVDIQVAEGRALLSANKPAEAAERFQQALVKDPDHAGAQLGLAESQLQQGQIDDALAILDRIPVGTPEGNQAARLRTAAGLRRVAGSANESTLRSRLDEAPGDLEARYQLGSLLIVAGRYQEALDELLQVVQRDRGAARKQARDTMLYVFEVLGEDPLARTYRNRLASVLFA